MELNRYTQITFFNVQILFSPHDRSDTQEKLLSQLLMMCFQSNYLTPVLRALGRFQFRAAALFALAAVTCPGKLAAQDSLSVADTSSQTCYCDPGVPNMQRPKGLSIAYETMYEYGLNAEDNQGNRYSEEVGRKHMLEAKLKFPVLLKPGWKVAMKLAYEQERFRFESNKANLESIRRGSTCPSRRKASAITSRARTLTSAAISSLISSPRPPTCRQPFRASWAGKKARTSAGAWAWRIATALGGTPSCPP